MDTGLLITLIGLNLLVLAHFGWCSSGSHDRPASARSPVQIGALDLSLQKDFRAATADMASPWKAPRVTFGRRSLTTGQGVQEMRESVESSWPMGDVEQAQHHLDARRMLTSSLALTTSSSRPSLKV